MMNLNKFIYINSKKISILKFSIFLLFNNIFSEGFVTGTLVKTPNGYETIENLKENDLVINYSFKNAQIVSNPIIKIKKEKIHKTIKLKIGENQIEVAPDHKFYCPLSNKRWTKAENLKPNQFILKNVKEIVRVDEVHEINKEVEVYAISIKNNHNFFVSKDDILVHNVIWIPIFTWIIGEEIILASAATILTSLGLIALNDIANKNGADTSHFNLNVEPPSKSPEDPDKKNKKRDIKICEKSAEHIFRKSPGHLPECADFRKLLIELVSDSNNFLGKDNFSNHWYSKTLSNGKQLWASVRGNLIRNAGINNSPRIFDPNTGLCNNINL